MGKVVVVSVYKSEAIKYLVQHGISHEDAIVACSNAEVEMAKGKAGRVVLLSAPMGVPSNYEYLKEILLEKERPAPPPPPPPPPPSAPKKRNEEFKIPDIAKAPEAKIEKKSVSKPITDRGGKPLAKKSAPKKKTPKAKK